MGKVARLSGTTEPLTRPFEPRASTGGFHSPVTARVRACSRVAGRAEADSLGPGGRRGAAMGLSRRLMSLRGHHAGSSISE